MVSSYLLALTIFIPAFLKSQNYVQFQKTFGGVNRDISRTFLARDSGFLSIGTLNLGQPSSVACVVKFNKYGDTIWTKKYAHPIYPTEGARNIIELLNGDLLFNVIIAGGPNPGYLGVRTNALGDTVQTFISPGGESFLATPDGGVVFFASSYIAKYSSTLTLQWIRHFGHPAEYLDGRGITTSDGGYLLMGSTRFYAAGGPSDFDWLAVKLDATGNMQWQKVYGTIMFENLGGVEQSSDGGFIMTGTTYINGGPTNPDVLIIKVDSVGNLAWSKTYGGPNIEEPHRIYKTFGAPGYIVSGITTGNELTFPDKRGFMYKIGLSGNFLWGKIYGSMSTTMLGMDEIHHAYPTPDGGFLLSGQSQNLGQNQDFDFWVIKTDPNGNSGCHEMNTIPQVLTPPIVVQTITPVDTPSVWTVYHTLGYGSLATTDNMLCSSNIPVSIPSFTSTASGYIYPNPTTGVINLQPPVFTPGQFVLYNQLGKSLFSGSVQHTIELPSSLPNGIYFLEVSSGEHMHRHKVILDR